MATVVHHKADRPWIDALSNAISSGTNSIIQQRMERDKLAIQISENAKQRAAEAYLTGMRIRGRYHNKKLEVDATAAQNEITNRRQDKRLALEKTRVGILQSNQEQEVAANEADRNVLTLMNLVGESQTLDIDKRTVSRTAGQLVYADKSDGKWNQKVGRPDLAFSGAGVATQELDLKTQLRNALADKNVSPYVRKMAQEIKDEWAAEKDRLNSNLPYINAYINDDKKFLKVQSWLPNNPNTGLPYTKLELQRNEGGALVQLANANASLITATLRQDGIESSTTPLEKTASLLKTSKEAYVMQEIPFSNMHVQMQGAGGIKEPRSFAKDANGKTTRADYNYHGTVGANYEKAVETIEDPFKSTANKQILQNLEGSSYDISLSRTVNALLPQFKNLMDEKGFVFDNFADLNNALIQELSVLVFKDQNETTRHELIALEKKDPLVENMMALIRGNRPNTEVGSDNNVYYAYNGAQSLVGGSADLRAIAKNVAIGYVQKQKGKFLVSDAVDRHRKRDIVKESQDWVLTTDAVPPPAEPTGKLKVTKGNESNILGDPKDPSTNAPLTSDQFLRSRSFTDQEVRAFSSILADDELAKVSSMINAGSLIDKKWNQQTPRSVVNRVFGSVGKKYLDGLRNAERAGDSEASEKLDAWWAFRRQTILHDMEKSQLFPWSNPEMDFGFVDIIRNKDIGVMTRDWFEAQVKSQQMKALGGNIAAEQAIFIYDRYNAQDGDYIAEADPAKRDWSWDILTLLNTIENSIELAQQQAQQQEGPGIFNDPNAVASENVGGFGRNPRVNPLLNAGGN